MLLLAIATAALLRAVSAGIGSACICSQIPCGPCGNESLRGSTAGGTVLRIYGSGFSNTGGNQAYLTYAATNVSRYHSSSTQVVATTPPAPPETWGRGQQLYVLAEGFTQFTAPLTCTYSPDATPWVSQIERSGQSLSVRGNFTADGSAVPIQLASVTVGGVLCAVQSTRKENITCSISPVTPGGSQQIAVCVPLGCARFYGDDTTIVTGTHPVAVVPVKPPSSFQFTVTLQTPSGAVGSRISLQAAVPAGAQIFVGSNPCVNATYGATITCLAPLGDGQATVTVLSRGGSATAPFTYVAGPAARLLSLTEFSSTPPPDTVLYAARGIRAASVDTLAAAAPFGPSLPGGLYTLIAWSPTEGLLSGEIAIVHRDIVVTKYSLHDRTLICITRHSCVSTDYSDRAIRCSL